MRVWKFLSDSFDFSQMSDTFHVNWDMTMCMLTPTCTLLSGFVVKDFSLFLFLCLFFMHMPVCWWCLLWWHSWIDSKLRPWGLVQYRISTKIHLKLKSRETLLSITQTLVDQSFWDFAQSTAVSLPCSVQNFKLIEQLKRMLWTNEILPNLSLRWVSDGYLILHSSPGTKTMLSTMP